MRSKAAKRGPNYLITPAHLIALHIHSQEQRFIMKASKALQIDGLGNFRDSMYRVFTLRGVNLDSSAKMPKSPEVTMYSPQDEKYWNGEDISFVGRPFPLEEADEHLQRIKSWGFNVVRYVYTWEALEHKGPGVYDDEFIDFTIKILKILRKYDIYVIMDPHQDLWSRYGGGSGAPLWTYYAMGLDPRNFAKTEAALVQNAYHPPSSYPKMIWSTNYHRLACSTMFTAFFSGREHFPKLVIDGLNIQDFLQDYMLNAMKHFYSRIKNETDLFEDTVLGVETMNEPGRGFVGLQDITIVPEEQLPKLGSCPTALETMRLGVGEKVEVANYTFGKLGPSRSGSVVVDPEGVSVWLQTDEWDKRYSWDRHTDWPLGKCVYALHGVWDPETGVALKPRYFASCPVKGHDIDEPYFVNTQFRRYWENFYVQMRELLGNDVFLLCQPPTNAIPPDLKDSQFIDDRVVYSPHYYDGLTLMLKTWTRWWNIDVIGLLRGDYLTPVFGIKVGEQNVRDCMRGQLRRIRNEGLEHMGPIPCFMTETGMPFDMDDKAAYKTGDYTSQILALDCLGYSLEGNDISHAYWCYCHINENEVGDSWNGEDFSFWSTDPVIDKKSGHPHRMHRGNRAEESINRPFAQSVVGTIKEQIFSRTKVQYHLEIVADKVDGTQPIATEIYLPGYHYPGDNINVTLSSGKYDFDDKRSILQWYHDSGEQFIDILPLNSKAEEDSCGGCKIM